MERTLYGSVVPSPWARPSAKRFTQEKIGQTPVRLSVGHTLCWSLAKLPSSLGWSSIAGRSGHGTAERGQVTALINTKTIRGVLVVAAAATVLSLAPRESFAQG